MEKCQRPLVVNSPKSPEALSLSVEAKTLQLLGGEDTIPADMFESRLKKLGFKHYKMGTYKADRPDGTIYLYQKRNGLFNDEATARQMAEAMSAMTKRGALLPETRWGVRQTSHGNYWVFAVTRALDQVTAGPQDAWQALERPLARELYKRLGINEANFSAELDNPNSFGMQIKDRGLIS